MAVLLCTTMRPVQRRRTAYNIDYAALNEGVGDDDNDDFDDFDNVGGAGADGANDEISPARSRCSSSRTRCCCATRRWRQSARPRW